MTGSGLLSSDYGLTSDPTASTASALGAAPLGVPQVPVRRVAQRPMQPAGPATPPQPEQAETNLTLARKQREQGENPSRDPNAQNPFSSAGGNNQIIDDTWLELMNKHHPEMVQGLSKEQILAMKVNGPLNDEMAATYDKDNAGFLASNGIAPTPNFISAAYRAGPQGALALIQAARENPSAIVKDIVPALRTKGNNGAGNLTVGQFLTNPYQRGPGAQEGDTPQQMFTLAKGNQLLSEMLSDRDEGKARLAKLDKDYKPLEIGKPPPPPVTDPLKQFSSLAGVFATLAAGFSRTPAIAAMNGLAGAMDAAKKNDWETYKAQYDQFKTNSELALKAHEQHSQDVREALEMMTKNMAAGTAMMNATMALSDDEEMHKYIEKGDYVQAADLQMRRDANAAEMQRTMPVTLATAQLTAAMHNRDAATKSGDPEELKAADALVTQAENKVAEVKRALAGGAKPGALSTPQMVTLPDGKQVPATFNKDTRQYEGLDDGRPLTGAVPTGKGEAPTTPEAREAGAAQAATGMPVTQISPGYGPGAVSERKRLHDDAIKLIMDQTGASAADAGVELANRTIEFQSGKRSSSQLTTMLGATRQAVSQLDFNIDKTKQEMDKLGSSDLSPVINAISRGEEKWTGDPAYSALFYYMHATAMESARILSGGQASVAQLNQGAADEAAKWANINMTPASFGAVAQAMKDEGAARLKTYQTALDAQRIKPGGVTSQTGGRSPPTASSVKDVSTEAEYKDLASGAWYRKPGDPPDSHRIKQ